MKKLNFGDKIVNEYWSSDNFKEELATNPINALNQIGITITRSFDKIVVEEQSNANTIYLNIPNKKVLKSFDLDLSEEDLEKIAGGLDPVTTTTITITVIAASIAIANSVYKFGNGLFDGWKSYP